MACSCKNKKKSFNADNWKTKISFFLAKEKTKKEMIKDRTEKDQVAVPGHSSNILLLGVALS